MYSCENPKCENTWTKNVTTKKYCSKVCRNNYHATLPENKAKRAEKRDAIRESRKPFVRTCKYRLCDVVFETANRQLFCCGEHTILEGHAIKHDKVLAAIVKDKVCANCGDTFTGGNINKTYCGDKCVKQASYKRNKTTPKPKVAKVKKARIRKPKGKKMYTPISKPEVKKKVVMALSKEVINCLEPEKKKADDLVNRSYTEEEASMISNFLKGKHE